jgi:hypothetical protein
MRAYSDPSREDEPTALPDIEVWRAEVYRYTCNHCGDFDLSEGDATSDPDGATCPSCGRQGPGEGTLVRTGKRAWFWWTCLPGCMPDSGTFGPFETKAEALADAQNID